MEQTRGEVGTTGAGSRKTALVRRALRSTPRLRLLTVMGEHMAFLTLREVCLVTEVMWSSVRLLLSIGMAWCILAGVGKILKRRKNA